MEDGKVIQLPLEEWKNFKEYVVREWPKIGGHDHFIVFLFCLYNHLNLAFKDICPLLEMLRELIYSIPSAETLMMFREEIKKRGLEGIVQREEEYWKEKKTVVQDKVLFSEVQLTLGGVPKSVIKKFRTIAAISSWITRQEQERLIQKRRVGEK